MPNRTIYVSDDDQPVYQRAQELAGGNLSAAITNALKRYVDAAEARDAGFDDIVVKVGVGKKLRKVRFSGILVGQWMSSSGERFDHWSVYQGKAGKYAVHVERSGYFEMRDAQGNRLTGWRAWTGIGGAAGGGGPGESTLDVVATLDELREKVPPELYDIVAASSNPHVEEIDI